MKTHPNRCAGGVQGDGLVPACSPAARHATAAVREADADVSVDGPLPLPKGSRQVSESLSASFFTQVPSAYRFASSQKEADKPTSVLVGFLTRAHQPRPTRAKVAQRGPSPWSR